MKTTAKSDPETIRKLNNQPEIIATEQEKQNK